MNIEQIQFFYKRDLEKLKTEINLYNNENNLWIRLVVGLAKRSYDPKPHRACRSTDEYHKTLFNENQFNTSFPIPIIIITTTV